MPLPTKSSRSLASSAVRQPRDFRTSIVLAFLSISLEITNRNFALRSPQLPEAHRSHRCPRLLKQSPLAQRRKASLWKLSKACQSNTKGTANANDAMITVTFALPAESSGFLHRLDNRTRSDRNGVATIGGTIGDRAIEVFHTGVGEKVCRQSIAKFLQNRQPDCLISAGFAGALNDQLNVGDLLFAQNFSTAELDKARPLLANLPIHVANLLTVPSMIDFNEERNKIARATGAAAVDMETEFIARACAEHGVPLLSLRVITDTPSKSFPAPMRILFDIERQRTDLLKLGTFFLKHPNRVPRMVQFARRIAQARKILAS